MLELLIKREAAKKHKKNKEVRKTKESERNNVLRKCEAIIIDILSIMALAI